jgi:hypothetical protein
MTSDTNNTQFVLKTSIRLFACIQPNRSVAPAAFTALIKVLAKFHSTMMVVALLLLCGKTVFEDYHTARNKKRKWN